MEGVGKMRIVLCRPGESGNIGSVCRAMKTMGFERLVLVGAGSIDEVLVRTYAVHAFDLYENCERYPSLAEATAGSSLICGTTRRRGRKRKAFSMLPEEFARYAWEYPDGEISLVFGNEKHGLSEEELDICHVAAHIPSSELFPSLNLSHAVQIMTYALFRARPKALFPSFTPVSSAEIDEAVKKIMGDLKALGFTPETRRPETETLFRDIVARAGMSIAELHKFVRIFEKAEGMNRQLRGCQARPEGLD
jgi:TrmH family RNA methyltransferase